ncbi:hypothetical protein [Georgenia wangjunii]|uniref:hypothetical protein n=1 Tax=Georgenia wangjunii TaxID=3117730 RepID=UPI002F26CC83
MVQQANPTPTDARTSLGAFLAGAVHFADKVLVLALVIACISAMPAAAYSALNWWLARSGGGIEELRAGLPALVLALGGVGVHVGTRALAAGMVLGMVVVVLGVALLVKGSMAIRSRLLTVFG